MPLREVMVKIRMQHIKLYFIIVNSGKAIDFIDSVKSINFFLAHQSVSL